MMDDELNEITVSLIIDEFCFRIETSMGIKENRSINSEFIMFIIIKRINTLHIEQNKVNF